MSYKEFTEENKRSIIRNLVQFHFHKMTEYAYLIEVSIATFEKKWNDDSMHEWVEATRIVTPIEAYQIYENILNGGLD